MTLLKIAFRNVFRNKRRSLMTVSAIGVGGLAVLIVGAMLIFIVLNFQSNVVRQIGHLTVYKAGYFEYGSGDPSQYGLDNYQAALSLFANDPVLKPLVRVITPVQDIVGLAGNVNASRSTPFFGIGVDTRSQGLMGEWDDYHLGTAEDGQPPLPNAAAAGIVGFGLGRILGICGPLHIPGCPSEAPALANAKEPPRSADPMIQQVAALDPAGPGGGPVAGDPRVELDLLAATAGGAPNVVSAYVDHAHFQANREVDDHFVMIHLRLAQELMYGRGVHKVTGIELQLYHTKDLEKARQRLETLFALHHLDFEVRDFAQLTPLYSQVIGFFKFIFGFISVVLAIIVIFMIMNTMTMAVMERINEIGTLRALGLQRGQVRLQFTLEGCIVGVLGATAGAVFAELIAIVANASHLTWTPPTSGGTAPLKLLIPFWLLTGTWGVLSLLASSASVFSASRASKMTVVDALRHV